MLIWKLVDEFLSSFFGNLEVVDGRERNKTIYKNGQKRLTTSSSLTANSSRKKWLPAISDRLDIIITIESLTTFANCCSFLEAKNIINFVNISPPRVVVATIIIKRTSKTRNWWWWCWETIDGWLHPSTSREAKKKPHRMKTSSKLH